MEKAMSEPIVLNDLELAALVSSRICHDVINPVSAISNGLEMLAEEPDDEMRAAAMDLILKSASQASAKLQFARIAFGAAGSAGAEIDTRDAEKVAQGFVQTCEKHDLIWDGPALILPKNKVKLLLNLVWSGLVSLHCRAVAPFARPYPGTGERCPTRSRLQARRHVSARKWSRFLRAM
jgi:histidine phosphotransferase ChpT